MSTVLSPAPSIGHPDPAPGSSTPADGGVPLRIIDRASAADDEGHRAPLDPIRRRRSIRRYQDRPVPRTLVEELLVAAAWAPSPHNRQPWRFAVLSDAQRKLRLAEAMAARLRSDRRGDGDPEDAIEADVARSRLRLTSAPIVIVAAFSMRDMDVYPDPARQAAERAMAAQATAAAVQTLLLAAAMRNLGSCWMCAPLFCPDTVRATLALPADWHPQALVTLGYPADGGRQRPRRPIEACVQWL